MRNGTRIALAACLLGGALAACSTEVEIGGPGGGGVYGEGPYPFEDGGEEGGSSAFGDGAASTMPMLVKIDPNASLMQSPGQGVGVFTQYDSTSDSNPGGHWYIWWTCDTALSNEPCDFSIRASVRGGITNAMAQGFASTDSLVSGGAGAGPATDGGVSDATVASDAAAEGSTPDGGAADAGSVGPIRQPGTGLPTSATNYIVADTTTTTMVQGMRFDTAPGSIVTLSATLGGEYSGAFLFFVQDGKVNGGYMGTLTDPLELQPSSP